MSVHRKLINKLKMKIRLLELEGDGECHEHVAGLEEAIIIIEKDLDQVKAEERKLLD